VILIALKYRELYCQLEAIDSKLFPKFHEFGVRYCNGYMVSFIPFKSIFNCLNKAKFGYWKFDGASNLTELHLLLENSVMIRRLKRDVMTQLPSKTREKVSKKSSVSNWKGSVLILFPVISVTYRLKRSIRQ
jgi:SWI/SNF-related matrix-associated actin-dependent regulator 1 of chromatin subfamily A